jgi:hypothetical protein
LTPVVAHVTSRLAYIILRYEKLIFKKQVTPRVTYLGACPGITAETLKRQGRLTTDATTIKTNQELLYLKIAVLDAIITPILTLGAMLGVYFCIPENYRFNG